MEGSYDVAREVFEVDELEEGNISAAAGKQDKWYTAAPGCTTLRLKMEKQKMKNKKCKNKKWKTENEKWIMKTKNKPYMKNEKQKRKNKKVKTKKQWKT